MAQTQADVFPGHTTLACVHLESSPDPQAMPFLTSERLGLFDLSRASLGPPFSVQFSHSVVSDSVTPWTAVHQVSCPSPTPGVHPNPCPLCWWCYPNISSSVVPFSSCPQSFPASGSCQMSQLSASGSQSTFTTTHFIILGVSLINKIYGWISNPIQKAPPFSGWI